MTRSFYFLRFCRGVGNILTCSALHQTKRLGTKGGPVEIKAHPFFQGVQWATVRESKPPFVPELSSQMDTQFFDLEDFRPTSMTSNGGSSSSLEVQPSAGVSLSAALPFLGFYFASPEFVVPLF